MVPSIYETRQIPDKLLLKRHLLKLIGAQYSILDANGNHFMTAMQTGFKLKLEVKIFADEAKTQPKIGIHARQVMDFAAAYDIVDLTDNTKIAVFKRKGWNSMVRDEWDVFDGHERPLGKIIEDNMLLALVRRFLTNLIPQNYDFQINGAQVVDLKQGFNPFAYNLHIDYKLPEAQLDRRIAIAAAVLLASIEGRQN